MLRSKRLGLGLFLIGFPFIARLHADDDTALWKEYGLLQQHASTAGKTKLIAYQMKDLTGALAAWESQRSPGSKPCTLVQFCTVDGSRTVLSVDNYVLVFEGAPPTAKLLEAELANLPNRHETSLPAILTFLPREGRVRDSARYILGPQSLARFAPELTSVKPGFEQGAEAQVADYQVGKATAPVRLAVFYYATPEMARLHVPDFKLTVGSHVKRSGVLIAMVLPSPEHPVSDDTADTLLGRVGYEAKITWNEIPPPSPIKPLYSLLVNILYMSGLLSLLCLTAGLIYAGMRLYRRRYGTLEADESMTTLHLTGD